MSRIIVDNTDGTVTILNPSKRVTLSIEEIAAKDSGGKPYQIVDDSEIPNREFRGAWRASLTGVGITVAMGRARDIHMARIRVVRNDRLDALDKQQLQHIDVEDEKQALRDIPDTFDLSGARTPEELSALWPVELE